MVYYDVAMIGSKLLVNAWLKHELCLFVTDKYLARTIVLLMEWLLEPCLDFVSYKCEHLIQCSRLHLTVSFLKLFKCMLQEIT